MINNQTLIMIGGGTQEVRAVRISQSEGYRVLVTDRNPNAPCFENADISLNIDGEDIDSLIAFINENKEKLNITGIFTLTEMVNTVAAVSEACGLPGISLSSAVKCQNKDLAKLQWMDDGISTPKGQVVNNFNEAKNLFYALNQEVFIKPTVGFGGIGSHKITSIEKLQKFFERKNGEKILMEELADGSMIDVNGFFNLDGNFIPLGCFDRTFEEGTTVESSSVYPSKIDYMVKQEAFALTKKAALSLGINWGPVKSDLVNTNQGLKILEIAPRLHGPKGTLYLTHLSGGTNHLAAILPVISGSKADKDSIKPPEQVSGFKLMKNPDKAFSLIEGLNQLEDRGYATMVFKHQSSSVLTYRVSSDAIGYIFIWSSDYIDLEQKLEEANDFIRYID